MPLRPSRYAKSYRRRRLPQPQRRNADKQARNTGGQAADLQARRRGEDLAAHVLGGLPVPHREQRGQLRSLPDPAQRDLPQLMRESLSELKAVTAGG